MDEGGGGVEGVDEGVEEEEGEVEDAMAIPIISMTISLILLMILSPLCFALLLTPLAAIATLTGT